MLKLVASIESEEEGMLLRRKLEPLIESSDPIQLLLVHAQGLKSAWDEDVAATLICAPSFRTVHRTAFRDLRDSGYAGPILAIVKPEIGLLEEFKRTDNAFLLERPYDPRDLIGLIEKFKKDLLVSQRIHRRFPTGAKAEVETEGGVRLPSIVRNLSKGGAYCEVASGPLPARGANVRLNVALQDAGRAYSLPARVVWTAAGDGGSSGLGVEFIGGGDVQNY